MSEKKSDNAMIGINDLFVLMEALSSCAIEGNEVAIELLEIRDSKGMVEFIKACHEYGFLKRQ